jgi:hypothetical protein
VIRVTVELVPHGIESRKRLVGMLHIVNRGDGTKRRGNYDYYLDSTREQMRAGQVWDFPRLSRHVWYLIARVLKDVQRG